MARKIPTSARDAKRKGAYSSPWTWISLIFGRTAYVGIVVFRPVKPSRDGVLALLQQLIPVLQAEWAEHRLWVVEPGRVRIREGGSSAV